MLAEDTIVMRQVRTFVDDEYTIHSADGRQLTLKGSALEFSLDVTDAESGTVYAQVTRSLGDLPTFLLSKETFLVSFAPGADETVRSVTIGALLAIDMIRKKERRADAVS
ncbi:hypothetical protein BSZ39_01000 [Bowdeniella nasicola]|uniref:Scramblase n=2 Tax=Bowdeniella nasicola TaxID=208480 RepID=A0A1Q5Q5L9_9ACTO|nr:hypothetical protein BSZ39_01000 [Bowdeniella nasicola]